MEEPKPIKISDIGIIAKTNYDAQVLHRKDAQYL